MRHEPRNNQRYTTHNRTKKAQKEERIKIRTLLNTWLRYDEMINTLHTPCGAANQNGENMRRTCPYNMLAAIRLFGIHVIKEVWCNLVCAGFGFSPTTEKMTHWLQFEANDVGKELNT
ncbi:hypothetical protein OUZ56_001437 [Daphnia magna]|uniref:Uncharacterized protein n=1 Tax=Daphnia magna TaxID=35525 RepID=A0ABR0A2M8_9CRUS|nr:hypothetical protein OUZ56_001437 [Daphnia magna]